MYKELILDSADENLKSRMEHYAALGDPGCMGQLSHLTPHSSHLSFNPPTAHPSHPLNPLISHYPTPHPLSSSVSPLISFFVTFKKKTEDGIEPPLLSKMTKESGRLPALKCGPLYSRAHWGLETRVIVSLACRTILTSSYSSEILINILYFTKRIYNKN